MIKKIVSKALLSVVMDKKARDKLETIKEQSAKPTDTPAKSDPENPAEARAALEQAEQELAEKPKRSAERIALVEQAMALRQKQSKLLDDLSPGERRKLQAMAMEAFGIPSGYEPKGVEPKGMPKRPSKQTTH